MQIHGLNKLTLLDYPGHLACTAFTGACNFRCPFCHNAPLVLAPDSCPGVSKEEFFTFLASRKSKLEGVCVTGGEPTLQPDLDVFLKEIKDLGFLIKLDTNGYRPDILEQLIQSNTIDAVAMDIKNSAECYAETCGLSKDSFDISRIEASIALLMSSGISHEFRTTIVKELHGRDQMLSIGTWMQRISIESTGNAMADSHYFLQNFKDSGALICGKSDLFHPHSEEVLQEYSALLHEFLPNTKLRG